MRADICMASPPFEVRLIQNRFFSIRCRFLPPVSGDWGEVVTELNLAYHPDLNIADGTKVMVEGGPWEGRAEEANLLPASGDRVACDVVGLALIKSYGRWKRLLATSPWEMGQVRRAVELGLGAWSSQELELVTDSLDAIPRFTPRWGR